ncbi:MAG: D-erythronate dehydrogenase [Jannaschia helgolandensis]|jgi:nucleoside-diphosphate-sugar epimerase|uniref:Nucleoside-diphosphate-sugar epimerase n=1 Tax=Jannaschia helgolandensis TaxID=188906 RepID=A0A1H7HPM0_9RHOB|nr:D-erythronate dehydrogenase [Jannaschia helgolandensis]SEK51607.1 Nucleoside-diphosphate-sugar epimerase [Jannaschia helgolandensis]|tara:strand:+ start:2604 stop:3584 length:981 start_codon:yes stop_codon:yes gene_type:complete
MHILITGASGMIGRKLTAALVAKGSLQDQPITGLTLVDITAPVLPDGVPGAALAADLSDAAAAPALIDARPDVIFHLAAIVSGEAEADLHKGYAVNLHGTLALCDAITRQEDYRPRFVFASSIAVFGAPLPDVIPDDQPTLPLTSYGTQKAMGEMLISDLSRRGALDGIALRLPTICIRPGKPNAAASGFYSSILREPLVGDPAVLPVPDTTRHWFASPRAAVGFLIHAAEMDLTPLGQNRALSLPGVDATVGDEIAALERIAGPKAVALIRREPDATIAKIVAGWPQAFDPARARALGFEAEPDMDAIIRAHIEDELDGRIPVAD